MESLCVGMVMSTESNVVIPVSISATRDGAEILLDEWLRTAKDDHKQYHWKSIGVHLVPMHRCEGITITWEK